MGVITARRTIASLAVLCGAVGIAFGPCQGAARARHISSGCADTKRVALTFDDGPNPPFTEQILQILQNHGATATFFLEGQAVEANPDIARTEVAAGMAVGSHSYAHATALPTMSAGDFADDLRQAAVALKEALGFEPAIYRSPFGHTSNTMLEVEHGAGYTSIGWDLDSTDWSAASVDDVVRTVLDGAHPGAIVLMHDGGLGGGNPDRATTIGALPRIIDGLRTQGYTFATIPGLTGAPTRIGDATSSACSAH